MDTTSLHYSSTILFITIITIVILLRRRHNPKNLPPSPPSIPFIGHLHLLKPPRNLSLHSLSQRYGPVVSLRLGSRHALILSSPAAITEALIKNDPIFCNHPLFKAGEVLGYNNSTMFFSPYGPYWHNLRRLTALELFSTRRLNLLSGIRSNELLSLVRRMANSSSGEVDLKLRLFEMIYNALSKMAVGKRFYGENLEVDIEVANEFRQSIQREGLDLVFSFNPRDFFPLLGWFDLLGLERRMERLRPKMDGFLSALVEEQRIQRRNDKQASCDGGEAAKEDKEKTRTLLDVMLSMQETDPETYTDVLIKGQILTVLTGGSETVADTIEAVMLLLLSHPEIMKKARTEIDRNIEPAGRILQESDLPKLPYLHNILKETLRLVLPMQGLPPRASSADCTIQGYHVPAGTMLFVNAWGMQRDPELWDDPMSFKPERFTGEKEEGEGEGFTNFKYIPFGAGKRRCPGQQLGFRMVTRVVGVLVQCFDWEPMSEEEVDIKGLQSLTEPKGKHVMAKYNVRECMVDALSRL